MFFGKYFETDFERLQHQITKTETASKIWDIVETPCFRSISVITYCEGAVSKRAVILKLVKGPPKGQHTY